MLKYLACLIGVVALLAIMSARGEAPAASGPASSSAARAAGALDKFSASLKQIEASLERHDLTDADLQALRQQIDPIADAVASALDRLTPRLAEIKARLDQLGPKPDDFGPPESPAVTADRADQQKLHNDTDELSKRARLLAVEAIRPARILRRGGAPCLGVRCSRGRRVSPTPRSGSTSGTKRRATRPP